MNYHIKIRLIFIYFFIILLHPYTSLPHSSIDHHVICSLKSLAKTKSELLKNNDLIHRATYDINQQCKKKYKNSIESNKHYAHRRDTVFFVHFDHKSNNWTLYKPSFITYDYFVKFIKNIYAQYGLQVACHRDHIVCIAKNNSLSNNYLTLDEFEKYNNYSDADNNDDKIKDFKKIENMKKYFFWHLQIPTTGLLPGNKFDIDSEYKPLAWHFLLWDLAPKKGEGAHVAIIDTGTSAFNIQDENFSSIYKKNINITAPDVLQNYGYNLVSKNGLDPIRQIAINFAHYCDHQKFDSDQLMENLPAWIIDFIKNKNKIQLEQYFIENAKNEYLNSDNYSLNEKGVEVIKDLLYGKYGIAPSEKKSFFNIVKLCAPYNQEVLLETLPAPKIIGNDDPLAAGHGTFTQGIVNAKIYDKLGISGLAPEAHVTMIKAFNDNGTTNKTTLNAALQRAITLKNPIVSMSLKITDEIDTIADAPLKKLIDAIDYVVAASGNDGTTIKKEAYPAKFDSVAFDVGAFQYEEGKYSVCPFTQKELGSGPKFVAPGFNLFSAGLTPHQTSDSMYLFMTGTSIAVPVITGFLALVLAEFQDIFTREQILKVIYKFSIKLSADTTWQKCIKLGTPDMRSALLCLHVLQSVRQILENDDKYLFDDHFDNLVQAIYTINYYVPSSYEELIGFSCMNNFEEYCSEIQSKNPHVSTISFFTPKPDDVPSCVKFMSQLIVSVIDSKKYHGTKILENEKLMKSLQDIITIKKLNLFAKLSSSSQNQIKKVLAQKNLALY